MLLKKYDDLLLTEGKGNRQCLLIRDFNTIMYNHTLNGIKICFVVIVYKLLVQRTY